MRDYLLFYINGKQHRVGAEQAFMPLSSYLRYDQGATGTKVVCEEGDCGACTTALGRFEDGRWCYRPVNSCIQFLYQLDCTHVVTIEGLKYGDKLNPVQQAMVDCHGAQCGYCTPGFVVAMCSLFENKRCPSEQDVKDGLTGNLCRCTGYEPIIKAALTVDGGTLVSLQALFDHQAMENEITAHEKQPVLLKTEERTFFNPTDINSAVEFKRANPSTTVVAGGTDVCVYWNKRGIEPASLMSVSHLPGLRDIKVEDGKVVVGARVLLSELEDFACEQLPEFNRMLWLFGSPQIRNAGTLAGNIANASPIADSLPFLHVMEAELELTGCSGARRVNINDFYRGYKQIDMHPDELITRVFIPLPKQEETVKLYKVSKRKHLDISAFGAAFKLTVKTGKVESISIAYGGVAPTVVRMRKTESFLTGKDLSLKVMQEAGDIALSEVAPISDVRGSSDFRALLARNILLRLFHELQPQERQLVCQP